MTIRAPRYWPNLRSPMVYNGDEPTAADARRITKAIQHLCGFGYGLASFYFNGTISSAGTEDFRVYLYPYCRHLWVHLHVSTAAATVMDHQIDVSIDTANSTGFSVYANGQTGADDDAGGLDLPGTWVDGIILDAGDGSSSGNSNADITVTNQGTATITLHSLAVVQFFNEDLEE